MLISRVPDESGGEPRGEERGREEAHHLQTANQLFELVAKDHDFDDAGEDALTTRDLVLLYKNIDLGKQLISNIKGLKGNPPNQYVETVVYQDSRGSDTDLSECLSVEDLNNIVMVNNERIELFTTPTSHTLCHKFGDIEIKSSGFSADYDTHFSFKDPYIKEQLNNLKLMSASTELDNAVLPASLLDYICCKRLEDNYNFYMDNIIRHVKNTIEQLKRISNGDYLTEKAKEKWKEVANHKEGGDNASKVLTMSTSIPLHVERKLNGLTTTWDDLVHSEVDLRSLAKILEKRIVVEVPKLISGSYKMFSKRRAENLVISCKHKEPSPSVAAPGPQSRVDVVFQLQRSESGQVVSNIDSIMILNSDLPTIEDGEEKLTLMYEEKEEPEKKEEPITETPKIIELSDHDHEDFNETCCPLSVSYVVDESDLRGCGTVETGKASCEVEPVSAEEPPEPPRGRRPRTRSPPLPVSRLLRATAANNLATPEDMRFTLQAINRPRVEDSVEGSVSAKSKKKSPPRVRVKSPYENKSHVLEERKRKKLLEVREQRELKKMAMGDSDKSKVAKNPKFCKNAVSPQASSSVTKLSITNKSFYNSIFGQNFNMESAKQVPIAGLNAAKGRLGQKKDGAYPEIVIEQPEEEGVGREEGEKEVPRALKYIDRSYYLDDAVTEMMYLEMKQGGAVTASASTSAVSNDSEANQPPFSTPSLLNIVGQVVPANSIRSEQLESDATYERCKTSQSALNVVPLNAEKECSLPRTVGVHKTTAFIECRRSIDKIYTLMNKGGNIEPGKSISKEKSKGGLAVGPDNAHVQQDAWSAGAASGTSFQKHPTSIDLSCFSFGKPVDSLATDADAVEPKVIISSKQKVKNDTCSKPDTKKKVTLSPRVKTFSDNPLKAISQLLHEFDYVQKNRQKSVADAKPVKKEAGMAEERAARQEAARRRARGEPGREGREGRERPAERPAPGSPGSLRARAPEPRARPAPRAADILDEAREARGEAVRGPVFSARLQALAQPRRSYLQALGEEPLRRLRVQALERAQRSAVLGARSRLRREPGPLVSDISPGGSSLERAAKTRRPASGSPAARLAEARRPNVRVADPRAPGAETFPPNLKKRMVAVESYVRVHYGRGTGPGTAARVPQITIPELASMSSSPMPEESSAIGSKLKRMVESVLARNTPPEPRAPAPAQRVPAPPPRAPGPPSPPPGLRAMPPSQRAVPSGQRPLPPGLCAPPPGQCSPPPGLRTAPLSPRAPLPCQFAPLPAPRASPPPLPAAPSLHALLTPTLLGELPPLLTSSQARREPSKDSLDYTVDVFSDKEIVTAVAAPSPDLKPQTQLTEPTQLTNQTQQTQLNQQTQHSPGTYSSIAELEMLENALYRKMSQGSFPKRLRIKNLTLTPKPSTQRIMVLQSGDTTSLVLKSKLSKIKINASKSTSNEIGYQTLSTTHVDWRFSQLPVQISTIGYSFPSYEKKSESRITYQNNTDKDKEALITEKVYNESTSENGLNEERDEVEMTCHYFKGSQEQPGEDCAVQASDGDLSAPPAGHQASDGDLNAPPERLQACDGDLSAPPERLQASDGDLSEPPARLQASDGDLSEPPARLQASDGDLKAPPARLQAVATTGTTACANDHPTEETAITTQLVDPDVIPTEQSETRTSSSNDKDVREFVDYTSSLDMLVGLLNEIQKITSCATSNKRPALDETSPGEAPPAREPDRTAPLQTRGRTALTSANTLRRTDQDITTYGTKLYPTLDKIELASELKEAAPANNPSQSADKTARVGTPNQVARDSRNIHPGLESNLITLYEPKMVGSSDMMFKTEMKSVVAKCVDKQVWARLPGAARRHAGVATEPRRPLALPAARADLAPRPHIGTTKVQLREIGTNPGTVKSLVLFHDNVVKDVKNVSVSCKSSTRKAEGRREKPLNNSGDNVDPEESGQAKRSLNRCVNGTVSDPMVRVKRDILVTVYSILVLTVFAALSLPEMLLHQA